MILYHKIWMSKIEVLRIPEVEPRKLSFACDIDDVLADSWEGWRRVLNKLARTDFSSEEIASYGFIQSVPGWQEVLEIEAVMEHFRSDPDFNQKLSPIEGAVEGLNRLTEVASLVFYLTKRPITIQQETEKWLQDYGFPRAPVICRPSEIPYEMGDLWKAEVIKKSGVSLVLEDNIWFAQQLPKEVKVVILERIFNREVEFEASHIIWARGWDEVVEKVTEVDKICCHC